MKKVLIVDDDTDIVTLLEQVLLDEGYDVRTAIGEGALRVAADEHPTIILLDIMMPGMDGVEVSQRLRADERTRGPATIHGIVMSSGEGVPCVRSCPP